MDPSQQKEQFSNAFLYAIAAVSGCSISKPSVDDDSIDWTLSKAIARRPKLDLQLKCTGSNEHVAGETISYRLKKKNYDDLRLIDVLCPRILVVVFVPEEIEGWLTCEPEQLRLRRFAFWATLRGLADSPNQTSVTAYLPANQQFDVEALEAMMQRISSGGLP